VAIPTRRGGHHLLRCRGGGITAAQGWKATARRAEAAWRGG